MQSRPHRWPQRVPDCARRGRAATRRTTRGRSQRRPRACIRMPARPSGRRRPKPFRARGRTGNPRSDPEPRQGSRRAPGSATGSGTGPARPGPRAARWADQDSQREAARWAPIARSTRVTTGSRRSRQIGTCAAPAGGRRVSGATAARSVALAARRKKKIRHAAEPSGSSPVADAGGGAKGDRTPDLMTASHALSQLSYGPTGCDRAQI